MTTLCGVLVCELAYLSDLSISLVVRTHTYLLGIALAAGYYKSNWIATGTLHSVHSGRRSSSFATTFFEPHLFEFFWCESSHTSAHTFLRESRLSRAAPQCEYVPPHFTRVNAVLRTGIFHP
jgi:hypothetical protein